MQKHLAECHTWYDFGIGKCRFLSPKSCDRGRRRRRRRGRLCRRRGVSFLLRPRGFCLFPLPPTLLEVNEVPVPRSLRPRKRQFDLFVSPDRKEQSVNFGLVLTGIRITERRRFA